jgi:hypothetical protein
MYGMPCVGSYGIALNALSYALFVFAIICICDNTVYADVYAVCHVITRLS